MKERRQFHILNGDALLERFPIDTPDIIVARECLVDGVVSGAPQGSSLDDGLDATLDDTLDAFFHIRASFLQKHYGISPDEYATGTMAEFRKIREIPLSSDINLWFEEDLFCQVNFWFCCYLIHESFSNLASSANPSNPTNSSNPTNPTNSSNPTNTGARPRVFLIKPKPNTPYSFAGQSDEELAEQFRERVPIGDCESFACLWREYQRGDVEALRNVAARLEGEFPFVLKAVEAHIDRIPREGDPGRPVRTLLEIVREMREMQETREMQEMRAAQKSQTRQVNFGAVFREFQRREAIYGFGDLQVKRLFDAVMAGRFS
jgi:hypothetical protein